MRGMKVSRRNLLLLFLVTGLVATGGFLAGAAAADQPFGITVDEQINYDALHAPLLSLFKGKTALQFATWKKNFRTRLNNTLLKNPTPPVQWNVIVEDTKVFGDHTRYQLLLTADGFPTLPLYLLIPTGASADSPHPAIICVHGHGKYGNDPVVGRTDIPGVADEIVRYNYDYGLQLVRRGYVVAAPCLTPFGRRITHVDAQGKDPYANQEDPCAVTFVRMQARGKILIAANLRDLKWTVDFLASRPEVKSGELGCVGWSFGGRMTMLLAAMDERIKAAVVCGAYNLLQERITTVYSGGCQIIPNLLQYGDFSEVASLIAPRPVLWEVGLQDPVYNVSWGNIFGTRLKKAYTAAGAPNLLSYDFFNGGHVWHGVKAYPFLQDIFHPPVSQVSE